MPFLLLFGIIGIMGSIISWTYHIKAQEEKKNLTIIEPYIFILIVSIGVLIVFITSQTHSW